MRAKRSHHAVVHHDDAVRILHTAHTLRDNQFCRVWNLLCKRLANLGICGSIYRAGAVIEYQNPRFFEQCPRDAEPLFLSARHICAALLDKGIVLIRHFLDKLVCAGKFACPDTFLLGGLLVAPPEVFKNRTAEQHVFLQYDCDLISERLHVIFAHIQPTDQQFSRCDIIQSAD